MIAQQIINPRRACAGEGYCTWSVCVCVFELQTWMCFQEGCLDGKATTNRVHVVGSRPAHNSSACGRAGAGVTEMTSSFTYPKTGKIYKLLVLFL